MKNWFFPTKSNNYTPKLLKRQSIILYTLILLIFNILTAHISIFRAYANVDSTSLFELHNKARIEHNLQPLKLNSKLTQSAYNKATAMLESDCWAHYCPNGKSPWDFFDEVGYEYIYAGENLAEGFTNNEKVFNAWMNSKTHRENILRKDFDEIGIAIVYGKFQGIENNALIVVHFGSRNYDTVNTTKLDSNNNNIKQNKPNNNKTKLKITTPKDDEILNTNTPQIEGTSPDGDLNIKDNNTTIGASIATDGIFTYRVPTKLALKDGKHKIEVTHQTSQESDNVNILIDTTPPIIENLQFDSIIQNKDQTQVSMFITTSKDTLSIQSSTSDTFISKVNDGKWEIKINERIFNEIQNLNLIAFDKANNKTEKTFNLQEIKGLYKSAISNHPKTTLKLGIMQKLDLRRAINSLFILFILFLIIIDYYALKNTTLPLEVIRAKTQYHFSMFLILFFISIIGGTAGELLTAQSL